MKLKLIFCMAAIIHITDAPFSFSNPFAPAFKDPTYQEHKQAIKDEARLGALLLCSSSFFFLNSMIYHGQLPTVISVPLNCAAGLLSISSVPFLIRAGMDYYNGFNNEKFLHYLAIQKKTKDYKKEIAGWRESHTFAHAMANDKRLYLGTAALCAGFLTSFTEMNDRNPTLIFTVAGIGIIVEKIIAEVMKS